MSPAPTHDWELPFHRGVPLIRQGTLRFTISSFETLSLKKDPSHGSSTRSSKGNAMSLNKLIINSARVGVITPVRLSRVTKVESNNVTLLLKVNNLHIN